MFLIDMSSNFVKIAFRGLRFLVHAHSTNKNEFVGIWDTQSLARFIFFIFGASSNHDILLCTKKLLATVFEPCSCVWVCTEPELEEISRTGLVVARLFAGVLLKKLTGPLPPGFGVALSCIFAINDASMQVSLGTGVKLMHGARCHASQVDSNV